MGTRSCRLVVKGLPKEAVFSNSEVMVQRVCAEISKRRHISQTQPLLYIKKIMQPLPAACRHVLHAVLTFQIATANHIFHCLSLQKWRRTRPSLQWSGRSSMNCPITCWPLLSDFVDACVLIVCS